MDKIYLQVGLITINEAPEATVLVLIIIDHLGLFNSVINR